MQKPSCTEGISIVRTSISRNFCTRAPEILYVLVPDPPPMYLARSLLLTSSIFDVIGVINSYVDGA